MSYTEFDIVCLDNIPMARGVTADGHLADSSNPNHEGQVVGLAKYGADFNYVTRVMAAGEIERPEWNWARGDKVYLNGTTLSTSQPASGFVLQVGMAKNPQTLVVSLGSRSIWRETYLRNLDTKQWVRTWVDGFGQIVLGDEIVGVKLVGTGDERQIDIGTAYNKWMQPFYAWNVDTGLLAELFVVGEGDARQIQLGTEA